MKKLIAILAAVLITTNVFAQAPQLMSYQAVIRDGSGVLAANRGIGMRIQILETNQFGAAVYVETQSATTNINGLVTIQIGGGTPVTPFTTASFANINWGAHPYFIKTETDPIALGGTNYTIQDITQLLSVPYALYAGNGGGTTYTQGNGISISGGIITNTAPDQIQSLSLSGNQLSITPGGNTVTLPTGTTYTAGNGISLIGNTITNTAPEQIQS